ncbi:right-handed parallel beta-helix repeat-containing protein [Flavivirga amylovorans]|uniref:Right-handed parallel beta-helix repeat-containing protein n=1 Tax=Flavivirga amylovorans TaxID=870486 RepID=A0ABT8WVY1_9FLAO|nr:right-handed parallel beta-helix repeat-containing protein [Flavivirga amylovorans]MDO5985844.1 right-handed parallel beta-helix repeat-containing protein [Flavivirga amylovorans]
MNKFLKLILLSIAFLQLTHAQTVVNVVDWGILPGKDATLELNELIASLKGQENVIVNFPKGTYQFYPENAFEQYRAVTNHDNSLKRMAFPMFGLNGVTIEGNDSEFIFHGRLCPFIVEGGQNITLKNFSINWEIPFQAELKVIETNKAENSFTAKVTTNHKYKVKGEKIYFQHYNWEDPIGQNTPFDPETKSPIWDSRPYSFNISKAIATDVGNGQIKFKNAMKKLPPVGTVVVNHGPQGTNRLVQAIHLSNTKDTYIENVTIYAAGGMGLIAERCENIHLNAYKITSSEGRMSATRADATHFLGCKGLIKLENCLLEHMLDDGINVHGAYVKVAEYLGDNQFLCEISHWQQWGLIFAEPGDEVTLISRETVLPILKTSVKEIKILNEQKFLLTVNEVPEYMPKGLLSFENITWNPDLEMKNNIIRENRARSVLVTTKGKVTIENNYFSSQMHGILIEGDNNKWYESGGVTDITIKNNVFENIGYGDDTRYPLYISPLLRPEQRLGEDKYHYNINFINNKIKSFNGHLVYAKSVKGLVLKGNEIILDDTYPTGAQKTPLVFDYCENVSLEKNKFSGFSWPITIEKVDSDTNFKLKKNEGVSR